MDLGNGLSCVSHGNGLVELRMLGGYSIVLTRAEALGIAESIRECAGEMPESPSPQEVVIDATQEYIDSVVRSRSVLNVTRLIKMQCVPSKRYSLLEAKHLGDLALIGKLQLVSSNKGG